MKVLIVNGSPKVKGNSTRLIKEMTQVFDEENIGYDIVNIGTKDIRGCIACGQCVKLGKCAFDDEVNKAAPLLDACNGLIVISPVYYASPNGTVLSFLDRLFYSCHTDKRMKVGAAFAVARRAGTSTTFDVLNKYFTISQMPIASGRYWNNGFGGADGQIEGDLEGLQNARITARNMVFLMKSIELGKEKYGLPQQEETAWTNFIR